MDEILFLEKNKGRDKQKMNLFSLRIYSSLYFTYFSVDIPFHRLENFNLGLVGIDSWHYTGTTN